MQSHWIEILLLICATAFRLIKLGKQSLWFDEAWSYWVAARPWPVMLDALGRDANPPLFYALLHGWEFLGKSEAFLRLPFAMLGVANALLVFRIGKKTCGLEAAWISSVFWSLSFFVLYQETEVRMYSLAGLFSLLGTLFFLDACECPLGIRWLPYLIASSLSLHTHYYSGFVILGQLIFLSTQRRWRRALALAGGIAVLVSPSLPLFLSQFSNGASRPMIHNTYAVFSAFLVPLSLDRLLHGSEQIGGWLLGASAMALAFFRSPREHKKEKILLLFLCLTPLLVPFSISRLTSRHLVADRYNYFSAPYFYLLFFWGLTRLPRSAKFALVGVVMILNIGLWSLFIGSPGFQRQDWKSAASFLRRQLASGDCVVVEQFLSFFPMAYYLSDRIQIGWKDHDFTIQNNPSKPVLWLGVTGETPPHTLADATQNSKRAWLVLCQTYMVDSRGKIPSWFLSTRKLRFHRIFPTLEPNQNIDIFLFQ